MNVKADDSGHVRRYEYGPPFVKLLVNDCRDNTRPEMAVPDFLEEILRYVVIRKQRLMAIAGMDGEGILPDIIGYASDVFFDFVESAYHSTERLGRVRKIDVNMQYDYMDHAVNPKFVLSDRAMSVLGGVTALGSRVAYAIPLLSITLSVSRSTVILMSRISKLAYMLISLFDMIIPLNMNFVVSMAVESDDCSFVLAKSCQYTPDNQDVPILGITTSLRYNGKGGL